MMMGVGTEKLREEIASLFPAAKLVALDFDLQEPVRHTSGLSMTLMEEKISILIGTQMVSKGLDFGNVSVVGIINADSLLNYRIFVLTSVRIN